MKTKYTLQELKAKGIIIDCPSREMADKVCNSLNIKPIVEWESDKTYLWVYWCDDFTPDFFDKNWAERQGDKKVIPASEFFMEDDAESPMTKSKFEELHPEMFPKQPEHRVSDTQKTLQDITHAEIDEDLITVPIVVSKASQSFDRFLEQWNYLKEKAMQIKTIKSLDTLTDKIKELL